MCITSQLYMTCISAFRSPLKLAEKHINCVSKRHHSSRAFGQLNLQDLRTPMNFSMSKKYAKMSFDSVSSFHCIYFIYLGIYFFKYTYGGIIPSHQGLITSHYKIYKYPTLTNQYFMEPMEFLAANGRGLGVSHVKKSLTIIARVMFWSDSLQGSINLSTSNLVAFQGTINISTFQPALSWVHDFPAVPVWWDMWSFPWEGTSIWDIKGWLCFVFFFLPLLKLEVWMMLLRSTDKYLKWWIVPWVFTRKVSFKHWWAASFRVIWIGFHNQLLSSW